MSVDSNGHRDDLSSTVTIQELDSEQEHRYEVLVEEAAWWLRDGVMTLEEMHPTSILEDHETPADSLVERFQTDVEERADELDGAVSANSFQERQQTTTDPEEIDWPEVWENAGINPSKPLGATQLALAIDVSKQTPVTDEGASNLIDRAVDAGVLEYHAARSRYSPAGGEART